MKFRAISETMLVLDPPFIGPNEWDHRIRRLDGECRAVFDAGFWWCAQQFGEHMRGMGLRDADDGWTWAFFGYYPLQRDGTTLKSGIYFKRPEDALHFKLRWG